MTNPNKPINVAEGKMFDCPECPFNQINPNLEESCQEGLWVSHGVARCNTTDEEAGLQQVRAGAVIKAGEGYFGGVTIIPDKEGLLLESQYRVQPNLPQRLLARIGINETL